MKVTGSNKGFVSEAKVEYSVSKRSTVEEEEGNKRDTLKGVRRRGTATNEKGIGRGGRRSRRSEARSESGPLC